MPRLMKYNSRNRLHGINAACVMACALSCPAALADVSATAGVGMFVQSDGNYSPLADINLSAQKWKFTANLSGYSESKTKVTHLLAGLLRQTSLDSGNRLNVEYGLGAIMAETSVNSSSERMVNYTAPLGLNWTIVNSGPIVIEAHWRSWLFASSPYIPFVVLLSHDRITTLGLSMGVSL